MELVVNLIPKINKTQWKNYIENMPSPTAGVAPIKESVSRKKANKDIYTTSSFGSKKSNTNTSKSAGVPEVGKDFDNLFKDINKTWGETKPANAWDQRQNNFQSGLNAGMANFSQMYQSNQQGEEKKTSAMDGIKSALGLGGDDSGGKAGGMGGKGGMMKGAGAVAIGMAIFEIGKSIFNLLKASSPKLQGVIKRIYNMIALFIRPMADAVANFLRPIARMMSQAHRYARKNAEGERGTSAYAVSYMGKFLEFFFSEAIKGLGEWLSDLIEGFDIMDLFKTAVNVEGLGNIWDDVKSALGIDKSWSLYAYLKEKLGLSDNVRLGDWIKSKLGLNDGVKLEDWIKSKLGFNEGESIYNYIIRMLGLDTIWNFIYDGFANVFNGISSMLNNLSFGLVNIGTLQTSDKIRNPISGETPTISNDSKNNSSNDNSNTTGNNNNFSNGNKPSSNIVSNVMEPDKPLRNIIDFISPTAGYIYDGISSAIGGLFSYFSEGGVVKATSGGVPIIAGEAGEDEYIIPKSKLSQFVNDYLGTSAYSGGSVSTSNLNSGGDGGFTFNNHGSIIGIDRVERMIEDAMRQSAKNSRRW